MATVRNSHLEAGYLNEFIINYSQYVNFNSGETIVLCWIPSHIGIRGNERGDKAEKSAQSSTISAVKNPRH